MSKLEAKAIKVFLTRCYYNKLLDETTYNALVDRLVFERENSK